jgi:hypothetical protein
MVIVMTVNIVRNLVERLFALVQVGVVVPLLVETVNDTCTEVETNCFTFSLLFISIINPSFFINTLFEDVFHSVTSLGHILHVVFKFPE